MPGFIPKTKALLKHLCSYRRVSNKKIGQPHLDFLHFNHLHNVFLLISRKIYNKYLPKIKINIKQNYIITSQKIFGATSSEKLPIMILVSKSLCLSLFVNHYRWHKHTCFNVKLEMMWASRKARAEIIILHIFDKLFYDYFFFLVRSSWKLNSNSIL